MAIIYCLALENVADILDFAVNAMSKVVVYHTTMSGIPEYLMVDTKIINLHQLCQQMALIYCLFFGYATISSIPKSPIVDTKIMNLFQLCKTCISLLIDL